MKKKGLQVVLCLLTTITLMGCGSSSYDGTAAQSQNSFDTTTMTMSESVNADFYGEVAEEKYETAENSSSANVATNRKLIRTVNMNVETETYDELLETLLQRLEALGGYAESFSTHGNGSNRSGDITARVPKGKVDEFLQVVEGASNITYRHEEVEDVTLNYVDMESRKKMLQKEQDRLLEFLDEAQTLEDIITLESRLTEVQYELESMESQLRSYDNLIDYSTVHISIDEVVRYTPPVPKTAWERICTGFSENLYDVIESIKEFFIEVIIHIPNIVVFLIVVAFLALIAKIVLSLERKQNQKRKARYEAKKVEQVQKAVEKEQK